MQVKQRTYVIQSNSLMVILMMMMMMMMIVKMLITIYLVQADILSVVMTSCWPWSCFGVIRFVSQETRAVSLGYVLHLVSCAPRSRPDRRTSVITLSSLAPEALLVGTSLTRRRLASIQVQSLLMANKQAKTITHDDRTKNTSIIKQCVCVCVCRCLCVCLSLSLSRCACVCMSACLSRVYFVIELLLKQHL